MASNNSPDKSEADHNLLQRVKGLLRRHCHWSCRALEVRIAGGVAVVQGQVPSFYLRQVAVGCIKRVAGVIQEVDLIEVADEPRQRRLIDKANDRQESSFLLKQQRAEVEGAAGMANRRPGPPHDRPHSVPGIEG